MKSKHKRGQWTSSFGFVAAAAGSAVGLGNLWKFPYVAGNNGGGGFVLVYLFMAVFLGFTIILAEMALGRFTKLSPAGAFEKISKKWRFAGLLGVLASFIILSYYGMLGGWVLEYAAQYVMGGPLRGMEQTAAASQEFFAVFTASGLRPVFWQLVFMAATIIIVVKGIENGIEKASKIMMPALFVLFIVVMIRSVTLPNAMEGIQFFLKPDFSKITPAVVINAMGQVFFSLSLGMGINITYGSYLSKESSLEKSSLWVCVIDTLIAFMAGLTILPAVFAFGLEPTQGPSLIFVTLPSVFQAMPLGAFFGFVFFLLVMFAALTSSVALLEVSVSYVIDSFAFGRKKAVAICGGLATIVGIPSALSFGPLANIKLFGMSIFDLLDFSATNLLLPIGGILLCIVVGFIWGAKNASEEISNQGQITFRLKAFWCIAVRYLAPVALVIIFLTTLGIVKL